MKKYCNLAFLYAMVAIACGVFYREFTKFAGFTGRTALGFTHLHLFVLGALFFLLVALLGAALPLEKQKLFKPFLVLYNIGLPYMVVMFFVRGILQVNGTVLTSGANGAISGIAGIAHIIMTLALVFFFVTLKKAIAEKERT